MKQLCLNGDIYIDINQNDLVFTPEAIAKNIIEIFKPNGKILEPCKGKGAFLKYLPKDTLWCEITEGKDFFEFKEHVDWIITNPPYSIYDDFLEHSFEVADNIIFLVPVGKVFNSFERLMKINKYGGIKKIWITMAHKCGFPFGFPCGAFYFKRGYKGSIDIIFDE